LKREILLVVVVAPALVGTGNDVIGRSRRIDEPFQTQRMKTGWPERLELETSNTEWISSCVGNEIMPILPLKTIHLFPYIHPDIHT
jgi:hypothetical protein